MGLIYSSDFERLPLEPVQRWLKLRDFLEKRLGEFDDLRQGVSDEDLCEYCVVLKNAAEELKLGEIAEVSIGEIRRDFPFIKAQIHALATKLSMRASIANAELSVSLPRTTKSKIFAQIERLRQMASSSELTDTQKKRVFSKLDELHGLVLAQRTDYGKLMLAITVVAVVLSDTTSFLADAPNALTTITALIGEAKESEEEEHRLLQAVKEPLQIQDLRDSPDTDDEIPF